MFPPAYFEPIRRRASERWDQLEADPELAAPWHLLFKQVQSPRHVLSELLQNADDAGATEASVSISDGRFVFAHNGEDFVEDHFASLCRFGYSNKRALHTIGFRGVGFKSTFSLGDTVELRSQTLSVAFDRARFTEPRWVDGLLERADPRNAGLGADPATCTVTEVSVLLRDAHRQREVEKNLAEWLQSPISLLFFEHLRCLRINSEELRWARLGPGPVPGTDWMGLQGDADQCFLVARFEGQAFPEEALVEIREERLLREDSGIEFPPCRIDVVLGAKGRLYVVLPTGVVTTLPFACNAPFIQDPARLKIKDPEISPTNRWLLERTGTLTASLMMRWLQASSRDTEERAAAYALLPDNDQDDDALNSSCASYLGDAFDAVISNAKILLTTSGTLLPVGKVIALPPGLEGVWPTERAASLLDPEGRPAFSPLVSEANRDKLVRRKLLDTISRDGVLQALREAHLPRPQTWRGLLRLWVYAAPEFTTSRSWYRPTFDDVKIFPVQGSETLHASRDVVRLAEKRLLQSDSDWEFLSSHLLVVNQNWPRFLADQRRDAEAHEDRTLLDQIETANAVFAATKLGDVSDVSKVVGQVAARFFSADGVALKDCITLAQIAAKLGVTVTDSFRFATRDRLIRSIKHLIFFDADGSLEEMLPEDWRPTHLLHDDYSASFTSCTDEEWARWVSSARAGLLQFPPILETRSSIYGRKRIENEMNRRGYSSTSYYYPYVTNDFELEDWDFQECHWDYWRSMAQSEPSLWGNITERIFALTPSFWSKASAAKAFQIATTGSRKPCAYYADVKLLPNWILRLRELPCLLDTRGGCRRPDELLRRTPETEPVMDVEDFVHVRLDTETNRPLLKLLGVREVPTGPDRLLECLRALAKSESPPPHEVEKWYRRLDQLTDTCSTADLENIRTAFWDERIVLTESHGWAKASGVFLAVDEEDVPGAAIVRAAVRDLSLWRKIGVPERPTADLAIAWLKELPSGQPLARDDAPRVRALLARHPARIWKECGHWLNIEGEWATVKGLRFSLTLQGLVPWKHLHQWAKRQTADFQRLGADVTEIPPFCELKPLGRAIEERFEGRCAAPGASSEHVPWLARIGEDLCRAEFEEEGETARVRALAARLVETMWRSATGLEITPYIDGTPAGTPRPTHVVWLEDMLYVEDLPTARLARVVPDVLARTFERPDVAAAFNYCFGRSPSDVGEYMAENFTLTLASVGTSPEPGRVGLPSEPLDWVPPTTELPVPVPLPTEPPPDVENGPATQTGMPAGPEAEPGTGTDTTQGAPPGHPDPRPPVTKPALPAPPPKRSVIERFALGLGFRKDGVDRFCHPDGRTLARVPNEPFPWQMRDGAGRVLHHYWPKEHCLERHPLELPFEIWRWIDGSQKTHSLILVNENDGPTELEGTRLRALVDGKKVKLFQATYRLVYVDEDES